MTGDLDDLDSEPAVPRPEATGLARVDAVVDAVTTAADRPSAEQVVVFEEAHAELRRVLDNPGPA